ncbi:M56 family metallopeptidase [Lacipirellula sp.]|uniref:M56 family metallopeptidase n=1 Tax=Lacipirellula sp. TaxID=2691419 RepID=UPI003D0ADF5F
MNSPVSWIETVVSVAEVGMRLAARATLPAALLAAVVLTINLACRRWLTAGQLGLLWALVLMRLVIPTAPHSSWCLQRFASFAEQPIVAQDLEGAANDAGLLVSSDRPPTNGIAPPAEYYPAAISTPSARLFSEDDVLRMLWLSGAMAVLTATAVGHWQVRRVLRLAMRCDDRRLLRLWIDASGTAGLQRIPEIIVFASIQQPAVIGVLRPRLLLPEDAAAWSDEHLRMVMLHELAHLRRFDLAANWLLAFVRAMQWWNPVYWVAARRFASLREQACDAFVASRMSETQRRAYGELLVSMAARQPAGRRWRVALQASMLGFLSSPFHRAIRRRLIALHAWQERRSRWQAIGAAALIGLTAWSGLTDANLPKAAAAQQPLTIAEWMAQTRARGAIVMTHAVDIERKAPFARFRGPLVAKSYDLTRVFRQLAIDEPEIAPTVNLKSLLTVMFNPPQPPYLTPARSFDPLQEPKHHFRIEGATLHAYAPESLHEELAASLAAWGDAGLTQICVETRLISSNHDLAAEMELSWERFEAFPDDRGADLPLTNVSNGTLSHVATATDEHLPIVVSKLDQAQAAAFIKASQNGPPRNLPQPPKVTVFNGQTATLADCAQRPFVIGVDYIEGEDGHSGGYQPKIEFVEVGSRVRFRATHSTDRKRVELKAHIRTSDVESVSETSATHRGKTITIQNPRVKRRDVTVAEELADGESLLVGCLSAADQDEFFYVLLTPQSLTEETSTTHDEAASVVNIAPAGR